MDVGLITNGVMASRVIPYANQLRYIRISLDSANKEKYNQIHGVRPGKNDYEKVIENIRALREVMPEPKDGQVHLGIGYLVVPPHNHTKEEIEAAAELAINMNVDYLVYRPAQLNKVTDSNMWEEAQYSIEHVKDAYIDKRTRIMGGGGMRWQSMKQGQHPTGRCDSKPLVAVIQANGDIAHCILYRNNRDMIIGNIENGSFHKQWFSKENLRRWKSFQVDGCPTPCKHYAYSQAVRDYQEGKRIYPVADEIGHHNNI